MDTSDLIIASLGMQDVLIESTKFDQEKLTAEIVVRQKREQCFCPECGEKLYGVKQWYRRKLRGVPLGVFAEVQITLYQLQGGCGVCLRHRLAYVPFLHPRFKRLSTAFAEYASRLMEEITCEATARLVRYDSKPLWELDQWRMQRLKANGEYQQIVESLDVKLLSADEVHYRTLRGPQQWNKKEWEIKFVTNLVCYNHSKVIANAAGRNAKTLKRCLKQLTQEQLDGVKYLAVDMHDPFIKAATKLCPNAAISTDRYHLAERINKSFDEVRKTELAKAKEQSDEFQETMLSGSRRFILVEREKDLSTNDAGQLQRLRELNKNIHTAMLLVEYFHKVLDKKDVKSFRKSLEYWYRLVKDSGLKPFKDFARLVRKYRINIENYVRSHLTTAVSEGLNNKIKVLKRMGYGYSNETSFMNKILQRCGFLNSTHINTNHWFFEVPEPIGT